MNGVTGILLAAGAARRFGCHKLMQPLADGTPVGVAAARTLAQALPGSVVVVRAGDERLIEACSALGLEVVVNPNADEGMAASLAAGIGAAASADGWMIALADMPWLRQETIRLLADALRSGASMVAPVYQGRRGHPVGFASPWRESLLGLRGDEGGRSLLARHADELLLCDTSDAGVLADVDRPGDLVVNGSRLRVMACSHSGGGS